MLQISSYKPIYHKGVIDVILPIQQLELGVPITLDDQKDLLDIENFYCKGNSHFWVALNGEEVAGTIALIDIDNNQVCLRKMFVKKIYRGKEHGAAQLLINTLIEWCKQRGVREVYFGTIDIMHAAHRFYIKNGFEEIGKEELPKEFPLMKVDNKFFRMKLNLVE